MTAEVLNCMLVREAAEALGGRETNSFQNLLKGLADTAERVRTILGFRKNSRITKNS